MSTAPNPSCPYQKECSRNAITLLTGPLRPSAHICWHGHRWEIDEAFAVARATQSPSAAGADRPEVTT